MLADVGHVVVVMMTVSVAEQMVVRYLEDSQHADESAVKQNRVESSFAGTIPS